MFLFGSLSPFASLRRVLPEVLPFSAYESKPSIGALLGCPVQDCKAKRPKLETLNSEPCAPSPIMLNS